MKKIPAKLAKYEDYLRSTERPAVEITFKEADTLPWESKCGDSGNCYFLISKEDLKNRNFDNVEYSWQCC